MEKISFNKEKFFGDINQRAQENKKNAHKRLYLRVSYSLVRDNQLKRIGLDALGVFIVLRVFSNKEGIAYPSLKTICYHTSLSQNTVKKALNKLMLHQWIKIIKGKNDKGQFANNRYIILQKDLIRSSQDANFIESPVSNSDDGI